MIADDNEFFSNVFSTEFTKSGYKTDVVANGQQVLDLAERQRPDLIILDLIMPVKDGFDTLTELKNNEKLKDVNVVVLSNLGQSEDIEKAKRLGAAGYIIKKDLAIKDLFSEVSKYLE
ncbi:hypothetical protein A2982_04240 [candidate division WWE3 bacterium RIFCSPLOWO2_01_FULL_39_13]|uniref:Response regulatory domain-containing protein n=1 Tax=candidate division WWE3 bacterium RIFCSPLOWO2_01_FULL_39_13 TaxID=1802624 RepID=A0A1F4V297_UNCKA|nr:MAG: hypothetical protein A2982_04240 [candidate division WWE3 bacterium RIFCSPLOWO2_01_FULL_39_13]